MSRTKPLIIFLGLILIWQLIVVLTNVAPFILPSPLSVLTSLLERIEELGRHALITTLEITIGLFSGTVIGVISALIMAHFKPARSWLLPVLVVSQAIPVFALAPVLVLWFCYGLLPKIVMATLIIYFPVTAALYDGLRRTETGWLELAKAMGASNFSILWKIRLPAAMPAFASGIRVATAVAPIGAVVGEWVGSSAGLGYYMLLMNARVQTDAMFAALFVLAIIAVFIYYLVDKVLKSCITWQTESNPSDKL